MPEPGTERCARCGRQLDTEDCFRLSGPDGGQRAAFCRLEHVVAWVMRGATWDPVGTREAEPPIDAPAACSHCVGLPAPLMLVRHRLGHRVRDAFCSFEHLRAWASAGGRWAS